MVLFAIGNVYLAYLAAAHAADAVRPVRVLQAKMYAIDVSFVALHDQAELTA